MKMSEIRKKIEKANQKFGENVRKGDAKAIANLYTDGASLLPAAMKSVDGKKAIEEFWGGAIKGMGLKDAILKTVELLGSGDTYTERGEYVLKLESGGKAMEDKGKYIVVWRNSSEGWKLHWDIWTSSLPQK
jgi:ketosteroid isomerase-like protein